MEGAIVDNEWLGLRYCVHQTSEIPLKSYKFLDRLPVLWLALEARQRIRRYRRLRSFLFLSLPAFFLLSLQTVHSFNRGNLLIELAQFKAQFGQQSLDLPGVVT